MIQSCQKWAIVPGWNLKRDLFLTNEEGKQIKLLYFVHTYVQNSGRITRLSFRRQRAINMLGGGMVYKAKDERNCFVEWITEYYMVCLCWVLKSSGGSRLNFFPPPKHNASHLFTALSQMTWFSWIKKNNRKANLLGLKSIQPKQQSIVILPSIKELHYYEKTSFVKMPLSCSYCSKSYTASQDKFVIRPNFFQPYLATFLGSLRLKKQNKTNPTQITWRLSHHVRLQTVARPFSYASLLCHLQKFAVLPIMPSLH